MISRNKITMVKFPLGKRKNRKHTEVTSAQKLSNLVGQKIIKPYHSSEVSCLVRPIYSLEITPKFSMDSTLHYRRLFLVYYHKS